MTEYGYARGSTDAQDGQGQVFKLTEAGIPRDHIYMDQGISGMKPALSRPEFARMAGELAAGDRVSVPELSRIGRNVADVLATVEAFDGQDVALRILDLGIDSRTPAGRMVLTVIAALARMERDMISERTKSALAARKAAGQVLGAPRKLSPERESAVRSMRESGVKPATIAAAMDVSEMTVYRILKRAS